MRGRIALVGDAAHPMLPFLAQGAAQAFEDGAALALCLREAGPGRARLGLERYERARLERASEVQRLSRGRPDINHLPDGPEQIRRDAQLAAQDPLEHNTWLYEHDVRPRCAAPTSRHLCADAASAARTAHSTKSRTSGSARSRSQAMWNGDGSMSGTGTNATPGRG